MKHNALLVFSMLLAAIAVGCSTENTPSETTPGDIDLAGVKVAAGEKDAPYDKLFVLNEGKMGSNNASVDFLRFSDGLYVRNSFDQMNPSMVLGLGDIGNDIKIDDDEVWTTVNGSGIVEVFSAYDEKHIATINVPSPRNVVLDDDYAYVTSYSGAYYGGPDRLGAVYRISRKGYAVIDFIEVGYQPEGLDIYGDKLFVANGGGLKSDYSYDDRLMVIDLKDFVKTGEIKIAKNLKDVMIDDEGNGYVTALGDYFSIHSGIYKFDAATCTAKGQIDGVRVSCVTMSDDVVYAIGSDDEFEWDPSFVKTYKLYSITASSNGNCVVKDYRFPSPELVTVPYGICVNDETGEIYVGDAGNYVDPGTVTCLASDLSLRWQTTGGINPAHMALWDD